MNLEIGGQQSAYMPKQCQSMRYCLTMSRQKSTSRLCASQPGQHPEVAKFLVKHRPHFSNLMQDRLALAV